MYIRGTACCALKEIANISDHGTPEEAMKSFCHQELGHLGAAGPLVGPVNRKLSGLYFFTGVVRYTNKERGDTTYGPKFSKFIKDNKLGTVTASVTNRNVLNHPTHVVRMWTWAPNQANVRKWWRKQLGIGSKSV